MDKQAQEMKLERQELIQKMEHMQLQAKMHQQQQELLHKIEQLTALKQTVLPAPRSNLPIAADGASQGVAPHLALQQQQQRICELEHSLSLLKNQQHGPAAVIHPHSTESESQDNMPVPTPAPVTVPKPKMTPRAAAAQVPPKQQSASVSAEQQHQPSGGPNMQESKMVVPTKNAVEVPLPGTSSTHFFIRLVNLSQSLLPACVFLVAKSQLSFFFPSVACNKHPWLALPATARVQVATR